MISLILSLAVIAAEAGDRAVVYQYETACFKIAEIQESYDFKKDCDLINLVRHWYGALVFSAVIIFGSSLMGLLSLFANISPPFSEVI